MRVHVRSARAGPVCALRLQPPRALQASGRRSGESQRILWLNRIWQGDAISFCLCFAFTATVTIETLREITPLSPRSL